MVCASKRGRWFKRNRFEQIIKPKIEANQPAEASPGGVFYFRKAQEINMYIPEPFREGRVEILHEAIRRAGLATLVSLTNDGLIASHIPLLLDPEPAPYGTLCGHLARPNPQARGAIGEAMAIFLGPDAYITPSWYPSKRETEKVVPTWNYVAIHVYGPHEFIVDPEHTPASTSYNSRSPRGGPTDTVGHD